MKRHFMYSQKESCVEKKQKSTTGKCNQRRLPHEFWKQRKILPTKSLALRDRPNFTKKLPPRFVISKISEKHILLEY